MKALRGASVQGASGSRLFLAVIIFLFAINQKGIIMSENKPNWADKANVALNTVQVLQNHQLQKTVSALGAVESHRLRLEFEQQQVEAREGQLRELIWKAENTLEVLVSDPALTPCGLHIYITHLQQSLDRSGVSTAALRQFDDIDRRGRFLKRLETAKEENEAKISPAQRADMDAFFHYKTESQELDGLIERLEKEDALNERLLAQAIPDREVATISLGRWKSAAADRQEQKRYSRRIMSSRIARIALWIMVWPTVLAWIVATGLIVLPACGWISDGFVTIQWDFMGYAAASGLIAIGGTILCARWHRRAQPVKSMAQEVDEAEEWIKLTETQIKLRQIWHDTPWESAVFSKFQVNDVPELIQLKAEREAFMVQFRQINGLPENESYLDTSVVVQSPHSGRNVTLSAEVQRLAAKADDKLDAIKLCVQQTGADVTDAYEAVSLYVNSMNRLRGMV